MLNTDLASFTKLQYFELSIYAETEEHIKNPWISALCVRKLALALPLTIKEACIYSQDTCRNLNDFIDPALSRKFEYLEIGFEKVTLPTSSLHTTDRIGLNHGSVPYTLSRLFAKIVSPQYRVEVGPASRNKYGFFWAEFSDHEHKIATQKESCYVHKRRSISDE